MYYNDEAKLLRSGYTFPDSDAKKLLTYGDLYGMIKLYSKRPNVPNNVWYTRPEIGAYIMYYRGIPGWDQDDFKDVTLTQCASLCPSQKNTRLWEYSSKEKKCWCKQQKTINNVTGAITIVNKDRTIHEKNLPFENAAAATKTIPNVLSKEFCADICRAMGRDCQMTSFNSASNTCFIKSFQYNIEKVVGYTYVNDDINTTLINQNQIPEDDIPANPQERVGSHVNVLSFNHFKK